MNSVPTISSFIINSLNYVDKDDSISIGTLLVGKLIERTSYRKNGAILEWTELDWSGVTESEMTLRGFENFAQLFVLQFRRLPATKN